MHARIMRSRPRFGVVQAWVAIMNSSSVNSFILDLPMAIDFLYSKLFQEIKASQNKPIKILSNILLLSSSTPTRNAEAAHVERFHFAPTFF